MLLSSVCDLAADGGGVGSGEHRVENREDTRHVTMRAWEGVHTACMPVCSTGGCQNVMKAPHLGCVWLRYTGNGHSCICSGPPRVPWFQPSEGMLRTWTVDSGREKGA